MEMAPWVKAYTVDMDKLYTESVLEMIENTPGMTEEYQLLKDYRELFESIRNAPQGTKGMGKKVLVVGDPGKGKSTFAKKIARDWSKGYFIDVILVFVVQLKSIDSSDSIEKIIIEQCPPLDGLKINEEKLCNILDTFGNKCLLILDGLDEYDRNKDDDVSKIIRGQKFYRCNVLITSRPHCVGDVVGSGFSIVRVQGFTSTSSESYAFSVLGKTERVQDVLNFYSQSLVDENSSHICPRLLLFLGTLVNKGELDLSKKKCLGEINMKLVGSLYRKFLSQKGAKTMNMEEFFSVLTKVGKVALDKLNSGKANLLKYKVLKDAGPEAFEYGFLIGSEITDTLFPDETADITITFPYRSVQEFLGAFHFIQKLNSGESIESLLNKSDKPVLMMNPFFLYFCLWLVSPKQTHIKLDNNTIQDSLKSYISQRVDHVQLDTDDIRVSFPALDINQANKMKQELGFNFLDEIMSGCQQMKGLILRVGDASSSSSLLSVGSSMPNLRSLTLADSGVEVLTPCVEWIDSISPEEFSIVLQCRNEIDVDEILAHSMSIGKQASLQVVATREEQDICELVKGDIRRLNITKGDSMNCRIIARDNSVYCPALTHLSFEGLGIDRSVMSTLSKAARQTMIPALNHLSFRRCKDGLKGRLAELFQSRWPSLTRLNLDKCDLDIKDMYFLSNASTTDETSSKLPKLTSLVLSLGNVHQTQQVSLAVTSSFRHPWPRLTHLALHDVDSDSYNKLCKALKLHRLPKLRSLDTSLSGTEEIGESPLVQSISELTLMRCIKSVKSCSSLMIDPLVRSLSKLDISHNSGLAAQLIRLVTLGFPSLNSLILSDCGLNSQDLSNIAQNEGNFPSLNHLDVSLNPGSLENLFEYPCKWNQLQSLNIDRTPSNKGTFNSLECLGFKIRSGCLSSLQELRFSTPVNCYTTPKNVQWKRFSKLYLCTSSSDIAMTLTPIVQAVNKNQFPVLNTLCIARELQSVPQGKSASDSQVGSPLSKLAELKFSLQKQGVCVYFFSSNECRS